MNHIDNIKEFTQIVPSLKDYKYLGFYKFKDLMKDCFNDVKISKNSETMVVLLPSADDLDMLKNNLPSSIIIYAPRGSCTDIKEKYISVKSYVFKDFEDDVYEGVYLTGRKQ